jgi:hypothetical protein
MGQQTKKYIKRRRRKAYLDRKKTRDKAGISLRAKTNAKSTNDDGSAAKKAVKKPAAKKVAKVKKEETPVAVVAEVAAPAVEVETPVAAAEETATES